MLEDDQQPVDDQLEFGEADHDAGLPSPHEDPDAILVDDAVIAEFAASTGDLPAGDAEPPAEPVVIRRSRQDAWDGDWTPQRIDAELRALETEIRELLGERDPRRKRKLTGTRRWHELQEDLVGLHYAGQYDPPTVARIQQLVMRRHALYRRLRFLALTRPTWNT